jgi:HK97 family phage prohead protease
MDRQTRVLETPITLRTDGDVLRVAGYASMYNAETVIAGAWREQIAPGAFASALAGQDDVRALFNHDPNLLLGRTKSGTLTLSEDAQGLKYDVALPNTRAAQDVHEMIRRGDVDGSSFGFVIEEEEWDETPTKRGNLPLVTIRKVRLFDVSPVTFPAYPQTSVSARARGEASAVALKEFRARQAARMRLDLVQARIAIARARAWA